MTCYLVRVPGEPVALVGSIDLACEIVFSQPPGYYVVEVIQVAPRDSGPGARAARGTARDSDGHTGDHPPVGSRPTIPSAGFAKRADPRRR
jgi:hypothetical protein